MKLETRVKRALEKMEALGIPITNEEREVLEEKFKLVERTKEEEVERDTKSREAEAVLDFVCHPEFYITKDCKNCNGLFATNYAATAYCSDSCRRKSLKEIGIIWDKSKPPEDRWKLWQGDKRPKIPLIVTPEALKVVAQPQFDSEPQREVVEESAETRLLSVLGG